MLYIHTKLFNKRLTGTQAKMGHRHTYTHTHTHTHTSTQAQHANFISLLFYFWNSRVPANDSYGSLICTSDWLPHKISHCGSSVDFKVSEVKTEFPRKPCAFTSFPFDFNCFWWYIIATWRFKTLCYEGWNFNSGNYLFTTDTK